mgnify:FL=1|jgi:hypothetical protein
MVASKISERADVGLHLLPRYGLTVEYMTQTEPTWVPEACTLPTAQQPLRLAEFDALFTADVTDVQQPSADTAILTLRPDPTVAGRAADLAVRETACCSFFEFTLTATGGHLTLQIRTPTAQIEVLDALVGRARGVAR